MANTWLKNNPFMSMWLSTANRVAGTLRGRATVQAKRKVKAVIAEATSPPQPKARPSRKR